MIGMSDKMKMRFALESSLGRLAKWLRILGFDSVYVPGIPENSFFNFGMKGRILLTRTQKIRDKNPGLDLLLIRFNDPLDQLRQVVSDLNLRFSDINPFSRCIRCNCLLHDIPKDEVRGLVPDYVYETQCNFSRCPVCRRIYWPGTHFEKSMKFIHELFIGRIP